MPSKKTSRNELYNLVWRRPMSRLSKDFGISDVGLAKICKKHDIPRPSRGYWARKTAGYKPRKASLSNTSLNPDIVIHSSLSGRLAVNDNLEERVKSTEKYPPIVVPRSLTITHPLVKRVAHGFQKGRTDDTGLLQPDATDCLGIRVSKDSFPRVLRILQALVSSLTEHNHKVFQDNETLKVEVEGEIMGLRISEELVSERIRARDVDLTKSYQFNHSRYKPVRVPSGRLCIALEDGIRHWDGSLRRSWRDTEKSKLEDRLDGFVKALFKRALQKKQFEAMKRKKRQ